MAERKSTAKTKPPSLQKKPLSVLSPEQSPLHPFPTLRQALGNQALLRAVRSGILQAKLKVSRPNDPFEQEADRVADRVMRMPARSEMASPILGKEGEPSIQRDAWEPYELEEGFIIEKEDQVFAKRSAGSGSEPPAAAESQFHRLHGGGSPLPSSIRSWIEPRLGYDFSRVQLHTDSEASRLAESVHARAFTYGPHLVFGAGEYAPGTETGRRLLAHELAHVVQQGNASPLGRQAAVQTDGISEQSTAADAGISRRAADSDTIHRVAWNPNTDTGRDSEPWGAGSPRGDILNAATDAGTAINTWRPHDGATYWCHGYTFGGKTARGGPYSVWGVSVPTILNDDGWKRVPSCVSSNDDILVFYDDQGHVTHSGIIRSVFEPGGRVDETTSTLESKWGSGSHNTNSWETNATAYGKIEVTRKTRPRGRAAAMARMSFPERVKDGSSRECALSRSDL